MGRWAQRRRGGGGTSVLNSIISVTSHTEFEITVRFAYSVTVAALGGSSFVADPPGNDRDTLTQIGPAEIRANYTGPVDEAATLTFTAAVAGFRSPQVVNL